MRYYDTIGARYVIAAGFMAVLQHDGGGYTASLINAPHLTYHPQASHNYMTYKTVRGGMQSLRQIQTTHYNHVIETEKDTPMTTSNFAETAMLVALNVRCYGARREDKKISKDVAEQHGTDTDAGKYAKNLVPKTALEPITKAIGALRSFHYDNTLPWLDDGVRILPAMNFESYKSAMEGLKDQYESAVAEFVRQWPSIVKDAQTRLAGMFNAADYPDDVRGRFGVHIRFMPVADPSDFRVQMSDLERSQLQEEITATMGEAQTAATLDLYARLLASTKAMADRLAAYRKDDTTGRVSNPFRDTLVENLRDVCQLIPRLNFSGDERLESMRAEIERELLANTAAQLRESDMTRESVAVKAQDLSTRLAEFMGDGAAA